MPEWLSAHIPEGWSDWHIAVVAALIGITSAIVSVAIVSAVLARLPEDFFINHGNRGTKVQHPVLRALWIVGRNAFGWFLIALGIVLSLPGVPGQGLLTILMGVMLVDFPGKYRVERWFVSRRIVLGGVNKLRAKVGRPPLLVDPTLRSPSQP
jgi:hypothetical protein